MYRLGLVNKLVTHANAKGFGLTSLSGVCRGFMPPQLKTNKTKIGQYSRKLSVLKIEVIKECQ